MTDAALTQARQLLLNAIDAIRLLSTATDRTKQRPISLLEEAIVRAHADVDEGIRSPSLNGAVSGGDDPSFRILDGLTNEGARRRDKVAANLDSLIRALADVHQRAATAMSMIDKLRALTPERAELLLKAAGDVQSCANPHCGKIVTGVGNDRLRAGRCQPCFEYRLDHEGSDRPKYLVDREIAREAAAKSTSEVAAS
jgi:hypothetical protein